MTPANARAVASYRSRSNTRTWQPEELVLRIVSKAMRVPASTVLSGSRIRDVTAARDVWWYVCATIFTGGRAETIRRCRVEKRTLGYALARVEDRRDDPAFDAMLSAIEYDMAKDTSNSAGH
jgi:hypothetical protein